MFRILSNLFAVVLLAMVAAAGSQRTSADDSGNDKDAVVKELALGGLRVEARAAKPDKPTMITDVEGLAKVFPDEDLQRRLKKEVDFKKQKLLFFAWSGSGGDRLTYKVERGEKGPEVVFLYKRGLTRDLRHHRHLFAVPKDAAWRVQAAR
jgi:hypothetical protein